MKRIDLLTALIVLISIVFFLKPNLFSKTNEVGLTSIELIEGDTLPNGGRNGTAVVAFFNPTNHVLECEVHIDVSQFLSGTLYEDFIITHFEPNITTKNFSLFLPNGDNKVVIDANC